MILIPGLIVTICTFPGVIVHEFAHRFFCDLCGVPVYRVCYFRPGNPAGYVIHGPVDSLGAAMLISLGPLIVNSVLCMLLTFPFVIPTFILHEPQHNLTLWVLGYLGLSIGMHAFPSSTDINSLYEHIKANSRSGAVLISSRLILKPLAMIGAVASMFWFDALYAVGLSFILPTLL